MMKVEMIDKDHRLFEMLEKQPSLRTRRVSSLSNDVQVVIITDLAVHYNELSEKLREVRFLHGFYIMTQRLEPNVLKHVHTVCQTLGVHLIKSSLTQNQIFYHILSVIFPKEKEGSKVAAFFAPISNIGTTSISLSTALAISRLTNAKVGVLGLNAWDDGTDQLPYKGEYLDKLKSKLSNQLLGGSNQQILSSFYKLKRDDLYYLAGNQNVKMERLYSIDEISSLITVCKNLFDVLILDAGCHFDNANMIESLKQADLKFMVMNQQRKAIKKFNQSYMDILYPLGYHLSEFSLILNRYSDETGIPNEKEILSELSVPFIGKIPDVSNMGLHSEVQQNILYDYGDPNYMQAIDFIAKTIVNRAKLELQPLIKESHPKSVWRLFSKLGAGA